MEIAFIRLTSQCNAKCEMCSVWQRKPEFFSIEGIIKLLSSLKEMGINKIIFTGGEPTLYSEFSRLNKYLSDNCIEFGVITNGSVLVNRWNKIFKYIEPKFVVFSLDGADRDYHDRNRKIDNLTNKVIEGINFAVQKDVKVIINTVITKDNFRLIEEFASADFMKYIIEWHWIPVKFVPRLLLSIKQWQELFKSYKKIKKENKKLNIISPFDFIENEIAFTKFAKGNYTSKFYNKHSCYISKNMIFIDNNGDVFRCNACDYNLKKDVYFGNINVKEAKEIINEAKDNILDKPKCAHCDPRNQLFNREEKIYEGWFN